MSIPAPTTWPLSPVPTHMATYMSNLRDFGPGSVSIEQCFSRTYDTCDCMAILMPDLMATLTPDLMATLTPDFAVTIIYVETCADPRVNQHAVHANHAAVSTYILTSAFSMGATPATTWQPSWPGGRRVDPPTNVNAGSQCMAKNVTLNNIVTRSALLGYSRKTA